jgi:hypothetical protein
LNLKGSLDDAGNVETTDYTGPEEELLVLVVGSKVPVQFEIVEGELSRVLQILVAGGYPVGADVGCHSRLDPHMLGNIVKRCAEVAVQDNLVVFEPFSAS